LPAGARNTTMARLSRIDAAGYPHHVIQRGNNHQSVFVDTTDYVQYLQFLQELARTQSIAVHAYVLMSNHVHVLITPERQGSLSRFMQGLGRRYVRWFNDRHHRSGTLWDGRFRSTLLEPARYLLACMRYIELNPVRAGIAADPGDYRWSSYAHHVGRVLDPAISDHGLFWALGNTPFERQSAYAQLIQQPLAAAQVEQIRQATNRGWALAPADLSDLAPGTEWELPLRKPRGRPKRS
jgi:REP-associated tyrosine transposase